LLNDQWVINEIKEEIERFLEVNENEKTTYQNLWDIAKAMSGYIRRTERSLINDLMLHLKLLENKNKQNPKNKMRERIRKRAKINEMETKKKKTIQRINETKSWFFENINKI
jgi:hypothetical protein